MLQGYSIHDTCDLTGTPAAPVMTRRVPRARKTDSAIGVAKQAPWPLDQNAKAQERGAVKQVGPLIDGAYLTETYPISRS